MLLDLNDLIENYRLLMGARVDSSGKPEGLVADTKGQLCRSSSAWGWWSRILGGLSGEKTLRFALEKTYRALEAIPGMMQELGRSGNLDERLGPLKIFPQTADQIVSDDKKHIEPLIRFVQHVRHFWIGDTVENRELVSATKKFDKMAHWLPEANLVIVCRRIASEEVLHALEAYATRFKSVAPLKTEVEEADETVRIDLVASQESIIEEQLNLIDALKAQLAATAQTPTIPASAPPPTPVQTNEPRIEEGQTTIDAFEASVRDEVKRLDALLTKIEERRGIVKEEPPAPLTMAASLGGRIEGGSSRHDVVEQLAQINKRLAGVLNIAVAWDSSEDPNQTRLSEMEAEIDRLSDGLMKAAEELAKREQEIQDLKQNRLS